MSILKNKIVVCIKSAAIILTIVAIYHQDLTIIANEAVQSELMSHILAIPFLFTYLIYRKRKMLRATIPFEPERNRKKTIQTKEAIGALLCLIAFLFYWHGSYTFNPLEYHIISLPIFTAGLVLTIFNSETFRVLAFPIGFLLFLVPPPLEIVYTAGTTLSTISSEAAYTVLKGIGLPVTLTFQYETPMITLTKPGSTPVAFAIDIACAGLYSLTGFTIFAVFVAYIARGAALRKAAIFLLGFPLIYALNITRIVAIVMIGAYKGAESAMQVFHLLGGWVLIFIGTFILLTITEKTFKVKLFTSKTQTSTCSYCGDNPKSKAYFCPVCGRALNPMNINMTGKDMVKIAILLIATFLIINTQVPVFVLTEGPAEVTIQNLGGEETTAQILPEIEGYKTRFVYRDRRFEEIAKQDASLAYAYTPSDKPGKTVWVTIEVAATRASLHRWEACFITYRMARGLEPRVTQISLRDVQILQNPPVAARYFAFQQKGSNITQVILYWYENSYFNTGNGMENKHVKISIIAFAENPEEVPKIEDKLLIFAKSIVKYWQPIKTWSQIALLISQNGIALMALTAAILITAMSYQAIENQKMKRSNLKIYKKLTQKLEKIIIKAVHEATKLKENTANDIASHYKKLTGKLIEMEILLQKLREAEEAGLIERKIISIEDNPKLTWKSNVNLKNDIEKLQ